MLLQVSLEASGISARHFVGYVLRQTTGGVLGGTPRKLPRGGQLTNI